MKCALFVSHVNLVYVHFVNSTRTLYNLILQLVHLVMQ